MSSLLITAVSLLQRLDERLSGIPRLEAAMADLQAQEQALDTQLGNVEQVVQGIAASVQGVLDLVQSLNDKLAGVGGVDLSDETARLEAMQASLQQASDALSAAGNPSTPAEPAPPAAAAP